MMMPSEIPLGVNPNDVQRQLDEQVYFVGNYRVNGDGRQFITNVYDTHRVTGAVFAIKWT